MAGATTPRWHSLSLSTEQTSSGRHDRHDQRSQCSTTTLTQAGLDEEWTVAQICRWFRVVQQLEKFVELCVGIEQSDRIIGMETSICEANFSIQIVADRGERVALKTDERLRPPIVRISQCDSPPTDQRRPAPSLFRLIVGHWSLVVVYQLVGVVVILQGWVSCSSVN